MKLLLICDIPLDDKEAQNIHIIELFHNLSRLADVHLLAPKPKIIKFNFSNIKYVPVLNFFPFGLISYQISLFFNLLLFYWKNRVDAFYIRQSDFTFMPLIISKFFRIPYIVEVNGLLLNEMSMFENSRMHMAITELSEGLSYKNAAKIIAVTQGVKKGIMELYDLEDEKIIVIENGANTDLFRPMDQREARKKIYLDEYSKYIGFIGNLAPWQGVEYLIQAAPIIVKAYPETRFLIAGDGIMRKELMQLAENLGVSDKVNFTGSIPYNNVPLYINAFDICVVYKKPIKSGYSPLKLYEYLACGKPVIASRVEGFEMVELEKAGVLAKPENPEELAKAIIELIKDRKLMEELGKNGRKYVLENHSWESIGKKVAQVCKKAIEDKMGT